MLDFLRKKKNRCQHTHVLRDTPTPTPTLFCAQMMEYLQQVHGFQKENITLMLDDKKNTKPTRKNITDAFKNLAKVSEPGDVVFIHFSGHGGKIRDFDGDEGMLQDVTFCVCSFFAFVYVHWSTKKQ